MISPVQRHQLFISYSEQPHTQAGQQQAPLELDVVFAEPGVWINAYQAPLATRSFHSALTPQGASKLGDKRKRTDPSPEVVTDHDAEQDQGQNQIPEEVVSRTTATEVGTFAGTRGMQGVQAGKEQRAKRA